MAETGINNGNGKVWSNIIIILAVIGGLAAIIQPMRQQQDALQKQIDEVKNNGSPASGAHMASMEQKFVEVETQFRGISNLEQANRKAMEERISILENSVRLNTDARNSVKERLRSLERSVFHDSAGREK